VQVIPLVM